MLTRKSQVKNITMNPSESVRERSVSLPVFTGKQEDFQMWWTRFSMYAVVKQFKNALKKEADLPDKEEDVWMKQRIRRRLKPKREMKWQWPILLWLLQMKHVWD